MFPQKRINLSQRKSEGLRGLLNNNFLLDHEASGKNLIGAKNTICGENTDEIGPQTNSIPQKSAQQTDRPEGESKAQSIF